MTDILTCLTTAYNIAQDAHKNQFRNDNTTPYIKHVEDVVYTLNQFGVYNTDALIIAYLHDVIEDCDPKYEVIIKNTFSQNILNRIKILTHNNEDSYYDYITKIIKSNDKYLLLIKLADLIVNLTDMPKQHKLKDYRSAIIRINYELINTHKMVI